MPVLEATQLICLNGDCGARYETASGWGGYCDDCAAMTADHDNGEHLRPISGCTGCF